jgi:hypothetical protein
MLLRSLTRHVRRQNWFAVVLDFTIVVVGVFIGIQVANWNQQRTDNALGAFYLERILDDIEADAEQLDLKISHWESSSVEGKSLDQYLVAGDASGRDDWWVYRKAYLSAGWSSFRPNRVTYDELTRTGQFRLIGDTGIRKAIGDYYAGMREADQFYNFDSPLRELIRQSYSPEAQDYLWKECFSAERYRRVGGGGKECEAAVSAEEVQGTLSKLRGTEGLLDAMRFKYSMMLVALSMAEVDAGKARDLLEVLGR